MRLNIQPSTNHHLISHLSSPLITNHHLNLHLTINHLIYHLPSLTMTWKLNTKNKKMNLPSHLIICLTIYHLIICLTIYHVISYLSHNLPSHVIEIILSPSQTWSHHFGGISHFEIRVRRRDGDDVWYIDLTFYHLIIYQSTISQSTISRLISSHILPSHLKIEIQSWRDCILWFLIISFIASKLKWEMMFGWWDEMVGGRWYGRWDEMVDEMRL